MQQDSSSSSLPSPLWLFGYGSVCWKPSFPYTERKKAYIEGFLRRFWQQSTTHRGTPESPGLTVTIIPKNDLNKIFNQTGHNYSTKDKSTMLNETFKSDDKVYGIAYCIPSNEVEQVITDMDFRETDGYTRMITDINIISNSNQSESNENKNKNTNENEDESIQTVKGLLYIGRINNSRFIASPIKTVSKIISHAKGYSGYNSDYLLNLNQFLHKNNMPDDYITQISNQVQSILIRSKL